MEVQERKYLSHTQIDALLFLYLKYNSQNIKWTGKLAQIEVQPYGEPTGT